MPLPQAGSAIDHCYGFKQPVTILQPPIESRNTLDRLAIDQDRRDDLTLEAAKSQGSVGAAKAE